MIDTGSWDSDKNKVNFLNQKNSVINSACDDVQELWEVEEDAGVGHDLLVRHETGEDGERHGLVHPKNIDD